MSPSISIIVPSFNQAAYIRQTLESILSQGLRDIEILVIDGGSTDGTVDILREFENEITWLSEPDKGQSDALNKGLRRASGEIIGWLNSDDYYEPTALREVIDVFQDPNINWAVGNVAFVYEAIGKRVVRGNVTVNYESLLANPDIVRQQGTFYRRRFLVVQGGFNPAYHYVMDFDLWIRLSKSRAPQMIARTWANFRIHQGQKTCAGNILLQRAELAQILTREGVGWLKRNMTLNHKYTQAGKSLIKHALVFTRLLDPVFLYLPLSLRKE